MCAGWTSKVCLGVWLSAAAVVGGGCQSNATPAESARVPEPAEAPVVVADATPVPSSAMPDALRADTSAAAAVSQSDVIAWVTRGTTDDVVLDRVQHAPNAIRLTAGDEVRLRDAGVTDEVIRAIKATAWN